MHELNEKYDTHKKLTPTTIETMLHHRWPGNNRELRNVMERIFVVGTGEELTFSPAPMAPRNDEELYSDAPFSLENMYNLRTFSEAAEKWFIEKTLKECGGRVGEAADRLGIHRSVLYRKLHKEK